MSLIHTVHPDARRRQLRRTGRLPLAIRLSLAMLAAWFLIGGCGGEPEDESPAPQRQALVPASVAERDSAAVAATATAADTATVAAGEAADTPPATDGSTPQSAAAQPASEPSATASPPEGTAQSAGDYALQLGSFRRSTNAEALAARIRELGHEPRVQTHVAGSVTYHRVMLSGLADRARAEQLGEELKRQLGVDYLVIKQK